MVTKVTETYSSAVINLCTMAVSAEKDNEFTLDNAQSNAPHVQPCGASDCHLCVGTASEADDSKSGCPYQNLTGEGLWKKFEEEFSIKEVRTLTSRLILRDFAGFEYVFEKNMIVDIIELVVDEGTC